MLVLYRVGLEAGRDGEAVPHALTCVTARHAVIDLVPGSRLLERRHPRRAVYCSLPSPCGRGRKLALLTLVLCDHSASINQMAPKLDAKKDIWDALRTRDITTVKWLISNKKFDVNEAGAVILPSFGLPRFARDLARLQRRAQACSPPASRHPRFAGRADAPAPGERA